MIILNRLWHLSLRVGDAVGGHFLQCVHIDVAAGSLPHAVPRH